MNTAVKIGRALSYRWRFLSRSKRASLSKAEMTALVWPWSEPRRISDLLRKRIRRAPDGEEFFDIGGHRIFFRNDQSGDRSAESLCGAVTIVEEAYFGRVEFFSKEVVIEAGDTVFDLGGNIGTSAMLFSEKVGAEGQVFSFEPIFHTCIVRNMRENGIGNVTVVPLAVGDRSGKAEFRVTAAGIDSRVAGDSGLGASRAQIVEMTTLDEYVADNGLERVDFIKMDIEGAEEMALRGGIEMLNRFKPKLSIASYHTDPSGEKQHPKLVQILQSCGYATREVGRTHIYAWHPQRGQCSRVIARSFG